MEARRWAVRLVAEATPLVPEVAGRARTAAPATRAWWWWLVSDLRRGIVGKTYHFVEVMHQVSVKGGIGSGTVTGREGPAVGRQSAIMFPYTPVDAEYVHERAAAARPPRRTGKRNGTHRPLASVLATRAGAQAATTRLRAVATAPPAATRHKVSTGR